MALQEPKTPRPRGGPFWDAIEGRAPAPPAARTLGWKLLAIDPEQGTIRVGFQASAMFMNPMGNVQGGFLAAMLDDTMGPALFAMLEPGEFAPTLELKVNFLRPAQAGELVGEGRVVHRGQGTAFLEGRLLDSAGTLLATATATARIVRTGKS
jgi:uncharacterized protein (TIGR00369 family)